MSQLHLDPPMTLTRVHHRARWVLPVLGALFAAMAVAAWQGALPWDEPIARAVIDNRTETLDLIARRVSRFGSTQVVLLVAAIAALFSYQRCPRLALAIVVIALARPLLEFGLKELIARPRPDMDRMVPGHGFSFPSGHPFATAASWCLLPLVVALHTTSRKVWWAVTVTVWTLAVAVAASRVYLGVHWPTDVVGGLVIAALGVFAAERLIRRVHGRGPCPAVQPL